MSSLRYYRPILTFVLCLAITSGLATAVVAEVPGTISYQGQLLGPSGSPVNGSVDLTMSLYDQPAGGIPLWTEDHVSVPVDDGAFTIELGSLVPIEESIFAAGDLWLGVTLNFGEEMEPRQPLTAVAFAFRADLAEAVADSGVTGPMIADGTITFDKLVADCAVGQVLQMTPTGWSCAEIPCTPSTEFCDALDNDCDGLIDEDFPEFGQPCSAGTGACLRLGMLECSADGGGTICSAIADSGSDEICDGLDNDCDGSVDEPWYDGNLYSHDQACGNCAFDCTQISTSNARWFCDVSGPPACSYTCCTTSDAMAPCDGTHDYLDLNGLPVDGCEFMLDNEAIYVSVSDGTDDPGCGRSHFSPCQTIGQGLSEAESLQPSPNRILIADGFYGERVQLVDGIDLLGGFRPVTWERQVNATQTVIQAPAGTGHAKTLVADGISQPTLVEGFVIEGRHGSSPGATSYAVWVRNSGGGLVIRNNRIHAGNGAAGSGGANGVAGEDGVAGLGRESNPAPYDSFVTTGPGYCDPTINNRQLANGGEKHCGSYDVSGGNGGGNRCRPDSNGGEYSAIDGVSGRPGGGGLGGSGGTGGDGGNDLRLTTICSIPGAVPTGSDGGDGTDGVDGASGQACSDAAGLVEGDEWVAGEGLPGAAGGNGGGAAGGGAGGGAYCDGCPDAQDTLGSHGGGGGSGGCGSFGGLGGVGGGASIAVFVVGGSAPTITENEVTVGFGGSGGAGGFSSPAGKGGSGGGGGDKGLLYCSGDAGSGGRGGDGGDGGGGGGGCGGASYGFYTWGSAGTLDYCTPEAKNVIVTGTGGNGGAGGLSLANSAASGSPGVSSACSFH